MNLKWFRRISFLFRGEKLENGRTYLSVLLPCTNIWSGISFTPAARTSVSSQLVQATCKQQMTWTCWLPRIRGVFRGRPLRLPPHPLKVKKLTVVVPLRHLRHVAPIQYCLMFHFLKSSWISLLPEARFLAWNSPNTIWRPGSARTRWGS